MGFYTYLWLREQTGTFPAGTPYYVGKGTGNRAFTANMHRFAPPKNKEAIILQEWPCEADAFEAEKVLILMYGRADLGAGCLRNLSDGGDGPSNFSVETRAKMSAAAIKRGARPPSRQGQHHTLETCAKISVANKGKKQSTESCLKLAAALTGRKLSPEHIAKLVELFKTKPPHKGCVHSSETRFKISAALKGKPWSAVARSAHAS